MILNVSFKLSIHANIIYKVITFAIKAIINHKRCFWVWYEPNVSFHLLKLLFLKFHIQLIKSINKLSPFTLSYAYQAFFYLFIHIFFNDIIFLLTHLDHAKISSSFDMHIDCSQTLKKYFFLASSWSNWITLAYRPGVIENYDFNCPTCIILFFNVFKWG